MKTEEPTRIAILSHSDATLLIKTVPKEYEDDIEEYIEDVLHISINDIQWNVIKSLKIDIG